jgi:diketogulonate reductase-like aldo/keto reductase
MVGLNIKLGNGTPVPVPGFGVGTAWFTKNGNDPSRPRNKELIESIKSALQIGYRHLDAAEVWKPHSGTFTLFFVIIMHRGIFTRG